MNITFVADLLCPYCYIGYAQLKKAMAARPGVEVTIGSLPFRVDPELPAEGVDFVPYVEQRFGAQAREMLGQVTEFAASEGLTLNLDRISNWSNSVKAHRLMAACPSELRLDMYGALFKAVFTDGRDIGVDAELVDVAKSVGLEIDEAFLHGEELVAETDRMLQATMAMGVTAVPLFIFEEQKTVGGARGTEAMLMAMDSVA
jgi:predicted DsbA family dithiol-disulfide isomerase